jgi:hypothetical protein
MKLPLPAKLKECKIWARTLHQMSTEALECAVDLADAPTELVGLLTDIANHAKAAQDKAREAEVLLGEDDDAWLEEPERYATDADGTLIDLECGALIDLEYVPHDE